MVGVETAKSEVNTDAQWSNLSVTYGRNDDVVQKGTEGDGETGREWDGEQTKEEEGYHPQADEGVERKGDFNRKREREKAAFWYIRYESISG